jgi:hypothetical protein
MLSSFLQNCSKMKADFSKPVRQGSKARDFGEDEAPTKGGGGAANGAWSMKG